MSSLLPRRARQLEFGIAVVMVAVVSAFLLRALVQLQEESEKVLVEMTVRSINSGLMVEQSRRMIGGQENTLADLARGNPLDWLERLPEGYVGAQSCATAEVMTPGRWCWEAASRTLFYQPRRAEGLKIAGDLPWLTWRIGLPSDPAAIRPGAIRLQSVSPYVWRP